jgi:uncharacterized protein YbjT (DUF2867 family)
MKAVILGSTGLVGSALLNLCLQEEKITQLLIITRRRLEINHPKVEHILISDLNELKTLTIEANLFFCAIGTTIKIAKTKEAFLKVDYQAVVDFAKICQKNANSSFSLISAKGANPESSIFYNKTKGLVEKEILNILSHHKVFIFRPGLLLGQRSEKRFLEEIGIKFVQTIKGLTPNNWIRGIATDVDELAAFMLKTSLNEKQSKTIEAEDIK